MVTRLRFGGDKRGLVNIRNQRVEPHRLITPPASQIEDRGTAIPIEDRDRTIPERLRLCGVIVKGLLVSLMWRKNDYVTSRNDHSARGTVGAGLDWTSFAKDSFLIWRRYGN
ncbi:hypothetical protein F2Q69_00033770 [Brassica cretica]|uniref:Uncharacterized protein n=1 Tax=Brassica cretica TaxID=69181 RepID=A0A8S9SLU4_BRACR|nr:hypothetical protein F2Q69_00033770 [Brassica cretica]